MCAVKDRRNNLTTCSAETAYVLAEYFESVFNSETYRPLRQGNLQDLAKFDDSCPAGSELRATMDKVSLLLNSLIADWAHGPDIIPPKLLKILGCEIGFVQAVTDLFNRYIEKELIPKIWKTAIAVPLHKKGSTAST